MFHQLQITESEFFKLNQTFSYVVGFNRRPILKKCRGKPNLKPYLYEMQQKKTSILQRFRVQSHNNPANDIFSRQNVKPAPTMIGSFQTTQNCLHCLYCLHQSSCVANDVKGAFPLDVCARFCFDILGAVTQQKNMFTNLCFKWHIVHVARQLQNQQYCKPLLDALCEQLKLRGI